MQSKQQQQKAPFELQEQKKQIEKCIFISSI